MLRSNLKALMEQRGITLKKMVEDTGLAEMTVIRARRGQTADCRLETLVSIANYLGCTVNDLFSQDDGADAAVTGEKPGSAAQGQESF